jgi:hypothetical protein
MSENFEKVKHYLMDLDLAVKSVDEAEELFVVEDEDRGIKDLVIDCEAPILVIEQIIMPVPAKNQPALFKRLLQMNRELVHGAFVLNEDAALILFRDTLALANLDLNELEGSINALTLGLSEFGRELLGFHNEA